MSHQFLGVCPIGPPTMRMAQEACSFFSHFEVLCRSKQQVSCWVEGRVPVHGSWFPQLEGFGSRPLRTEA